MKRRIRLHIVNCDPLKPELVERFGNYPSMFRELFAAALAEASTRHTLRSDMECELLIDSSDAFATPAPSFASLQYADVLLITGSAASVYENKPWIANLLDIVRRWVAAKKKIIGICFGHQLIAQALGGEVQKSERGWGIGRRELPVLQPMPWMGQTAPETIALLYSHQDQVVKLPENAEIILGDSFCPVAGFVIGSQLMTLQGHPEFSIDYISEILRRRRQLIGEEKADQALASSQNYTSEEAKVAPRWMLQFLCDA